MPCNYLFGQGIGQGNMKSYIEKLKDPRWQKKRLEILSRDNFFCKNCDDDTKTLHVHHCGYSTIYKNPWDYPNGWLLTLCEDCHEAETKYLKDRKGYLIDYMSSKGFITYDYDVMCDAIMEMSRKNLKPHDLVTLILRYSEDLKND